MFLKFIHQFVAYRFIIADDAPKIFVTSGAEPTPILRRLSGIVIPDDPPNQHIFALTFEFVSPVRAPLVVEMRFRVLRRLPLPSLCLIVHVLKFSRGAVMYLPAGSSGHIVSSNYDLYSEFYMGWVFTIILYILVRLLFCLLGWPRVPVGGESR